MSEIRKRDIVIPKKPSDSAILKSKEGWVEEMDAMVGKPCEVEYIDSDGSVSVYTPDKSDNWVFHKSWLIHTTL